MIKNYIKIAWRNLIRSLGFSLTNVLGLSIGITCTILIFMWVKNELSYDKHNENYNDVYQILANRDFKNTIFTDESMAFPLSSALQNSNPAIKSAAITTHAEDHLVEYNGNKLKKTGRYTGGDFFDIFTVKFMIGSAAALKDPRSVIISQSTAKAFFGDADPMNKVLKFDNQNNYKVAAVTKDMPQNSTVQFDFLVPFDYSSPNVQASMKEWVNSSWYVYIKTAPGANIASVEKFINDVKHQHDTHDQISTYFAFPMSKWHLQSEFKEGKNVGGMIQYVKLFTIIAIVILIIACVNFMNLSTARSEKRAKEVGIRKTLGSDKKQLIIQFFFESMILSLIAFVISVLTVLLLLPAFNNLVNQRLSLNLTDPVFWLGALLIILFTGITAGSYPAIYLSSFNPVKVLKGTFAAGKSAVLPRKVLVVMQFVTSILLISVTIIVYQQIQHVKNRDIGYNPNNLIMIPSSQAVDKSYSAVKNELLGTGVISAVSRTMSPITQVWWKSPSPDYDGKPADVNVIFTGLNVDVDYTKTVGARIIKGHDFTGKPSDSLSMMLNEAAVKVLNLKDPIGMQMRYGRRKFTVIGVTSNVVMESPFKPVDPQMIYYRPDGSSMVNVRVKNGVNPKKAIAALEPIFKKYNPENLFEYQFVDQEFGKKFITEELIGNITNIFAGLAILICCIGLGGLASFTVEKRFREIGIRKVVGANVQQLLSLISKEFMQLVGIAFIIAVPLTWWLMYKWLQNYEYRVSIQIWLFGIVGVIILLLTLIIVSLNTIRAALANPVKSLRSE
ncbi:ABC transporter permease [Mucilaginibacter ginkgonis]|uniref:ABC transporter permease n=1 Tax=Mucilaginibacter ginkgonis TaxID=2682091 RepID=A0A6I4HWI7_9SPHI|nr:ABC transporter permease [Mucilaginibacter ginkgonis]QQL51325.1 ABC transporter permease [Mucilaginibacter ginkgonis]